MLLIGLFSPNEVLKLSTEGISDCALTWRVGILSRTHRNALVPRFDDRSWTHTGMGAPSSGTGGRTGRHWNSERAFGDSRRKKREAGQEPTTRGKPVMAVLSRVREFSKQAL
jgi:hypothetical protein